MKTFSVQVCMKKYGTVQVKAKDEDDAIEKVEDMKDLDIALRIEVDNEEVEVESAEEVDDEDGE